MFWKKKKSKGLPDLPSPEITTSKAKAKEDISSLPSFPDNPSKKGFSQSMIKGAIDPEERPSFPFSKTDVRKPITQEISEHGPLPEIPGNHEEKKLHFPPTEKGEKPKAREINEWKPHEIENSERKITERGPVFVKLDKFNEARDSLEKIKEKLDEIDEMLKTLKNVKYKEEKELTEWEKGIEELKARLDSLTSNVFENVER